jgi:two-component system chemotaxis response regulator CheY
VKQQGEVSSMEGFKTLVRKKDGKPVRYLIVDDSVFARKNVQRILAMFGGEVAGEAGDGRAAIDEYDRVRPDLVLMDVTMPDMEGIEAAEQITARDPQARIVMVSSVGYQENISEAFRKGALHFVQKPPKPEILYEVIKRVLGDQGATLPASPGEIQDHAN